MSFKERMRDSGTEKAEALQSQGNETLQRAGRVELV